MPTITVNAGGNLQGALNAAVPGDTIVLEKAATWAGTYVLPYKVGSSPITIRTSGSIPASGTRITPSFLGQLATLACPGGGVPALKTQPGTAYWTLVGINLTGDPKGQNDMMRLGDGDRNLQYLESQIPHDIVIDRCILRGNPTYGQKRAISMNANTVTVKGCYIYDIRATQDSQAIGCTNAFGPYTIDNNHLEAAGENILFGGDQMHPNFTGRAPSNITITNNYLYKPLAWMGALAPSGVKWVVKNIIEFKHANQVTVQGNILENCWKSGQQGFAFMLTPRNQYGSVTDPTAGNPWVNVENITITKNTIKNVGGFVDILGTDNLGKSATLHDVVISHNRIIGLSATKPGINAKDLGGFGYFALINGGVNITLDHNTCPYASGASGTLNDLGLATPYEYLYLDGDCAIQNFVFTNNILPRSKYGVIGKNASVGADSILKHTNGLDWRKNAVIGGPNNGQADFFPADVPAVKLVSYPADVTLQGASPYHNAGTDGLDLGAIF